MDSTTTIRAVVLATMATLAPAMTAGAQQALLGPGAAFISIGGMRVATEELDARLDAVGYPTFGRSARSVGIGAYRILRNGLVLGGEFNGLIMDEKRHNGRDVGIGGGYATLGIGYVRELSPRVRAYPRIGLGPGGLALWIQDAPDTVDFDDVLNDPQPTPGRQPVLSRDGAVIDVGAGLEILPRGNRSGLLIGARAGYLFTRFGSESDWQFNHRTARGGPPASIAGPYIRFALGGAWRR